MKRRRMLVISLLFITSFPIMVASKIFAINGMDGLAAFAYTTGLMIGIVIVTTGLDRNEN